MTEKDSVILIAEDDKTAFTSLYNKYYDRFHRFISLYNISETEKEDIMQDIFTKVWDERIYIREKDHFINYLYIMAKNAIHHQSQKDLNENNYKMTILNNIEYSYEIENEIVTSDLRSCLSNILKELTPRQREIFRLSRIEHLTYKEIAERLSISEKTIERHINGALKYIRKSIQ